MRINDTIRLLLLLVCMFTGFSSFSKEYEVNEAKEKSERYFRYLYDHIRFPKGKKIAFQPFKSGLHGYFNLIESGKIAAGSLLTICDFTLSSNQKRMWVFDLKQQKVLFHTLVAHGMNTGEEFATAFSNVEESHQSSLGFYTTSETYDGSNGYSLKLNGVDGQFNSKAYDRAIVIHGAEYVSDEYARCNQRIGRSHGCPALPVDIAPKVIDRIKNGHCLFIYHPSNNYLTSSHWLKRTVSQLPRDAEQMDFLSNTTQKPELNELEANRDEKLDPALIKECSEPSVGNVVTDKVQVSEYDRANYKIEVQCIIIKEGKPASKPLPKNISSVIVVNQNNRSGMSDTTIVK